MFGPMLSSMFNRHKKQQLRDFSQSFGNLSDTKVRKAAIRIASCFTETAFHELFHMKAFASGWTTSDAQAVWYSLGYFCFQFSVTMTNCFDTELIPALLNSGQNQLLFQWRMNDLVRDKYLNFLEQNKIEIVEAHRAIKDTEALTLFFLHYIDRILGGKTSFADRSVFESLMRGNEVLYYDPAFLISVRSFFIETDQKAQVALMDT